MADRKVYSTVHSRANQKETLMVLLKASRRDHWMAGKRVTKMELPRETRKDY
jgi:hypothetical protein